MQYLSEQSTISQAMEANEQANRDHRDRLDYCHGKLGLPARASLDHLLALLQEMDRKWSPPETLDFKLKEMERS